MALALTSWTDHISTCTNERPADPDERERCDKLDACFVAVPTDAIVSLGRSGEQFVSPPLDNGMTLDAGRIFFTLAQYPADDVRVQPGCKCDRGGHIVVGERGATPVPGVLAAGDITPGPLLAVRAAAGGAVAAMAMQKSLLPDHRILSAVVKA